MYVDGDLRVAVGNQTWTFNPACVSQVPAGILTDLNNTMGHNEREDLQSKIGLSFLSGKKFTFSDNQIVPKVCIQVLNIS